jgi:hypothetical protein
MEKDHKISKNKQQFNQYDKDMLISEITKLNDMVKYLNFQKNSLSYYLDDIFEKVLSKKYIDEQLKNKEKEYEQILQLRREAYNIGGWDINEWEEWSYKEKISDNPITFWKNIITNLKTNQIKSDLNLFQKNKLFV